MHVTSLLIVDDNPRFRSRARRALEPAFEVVAEAFDARSGLEAARALRPEVVLLDVGLPDRSGLAVAEELAREPGGPAVVLTSTRDPEDFGAWVARSGARGFIAKSALSDAALIAALG